MNNLLHALVPEILDVLGWGVVETSVVARAPSHTGAAVPVFFAVETDRRPRLPNPLLCSPLWFVALSKTKPKKPSPPPKTVSPSPSRPPNPS